MANEYKNQHDTFNRLSDSDKQRVIDAAEAETKMIRHLNAWIDAPDPTEQALAIAEKADNANKGIINRFF